MSPETTDVITSKNENFFAWKHGIVIYLYFVIVLTFYELTIIFALRTGQLVAILTILDFQLDLRSCFAQNAVCRNFKQYSMLDYFFSLLNSCLAQNTFYSNLRRY